MVFSKKIFSVFRQWELNFRTRKKLVATASRCESVYNRTGEPSVTFCEKEEQGSGRMTYFLSQTNNKSEQSELCSDVVEARGVEPLSENHLSRLSPSAADPLDSPHRAPTDRLPVAVSALVMTGPTASPCSRSPLNHAPIPAAVFRVGTAA